MVGDLPDFFLMRLDALNDLVRMQLPEKELSSLGSKNHVFVTGQDGHTKHAWLFKVKFGLNL